jgi:MYXO-CTERM domain-containing protein
VYNLACQLDSTVVTYFAMKLIGVIFTAVLLSLGEMGFAQGFINLNFESASLIPAAPFEVQFAQAFPGWIGTVGGVQQTLALSNSIYLDTSGISIINSHYNDLGIGPAGPLQGNYTAILQAGLYGVPADTSLSQTGLVPANAQSLQFEAIPPVNRAGDVVPFEVTLGGQDLSLTVISNALNYTLYGADIGAWAGQTAQLSFTVFAENPHMDNQYLSLDAIQFSAQPVPEPNEFALAALGALFLGFRRRRR